MSYLSHIHCLPRVRNILLLGRILEYIAKLIYFYTFFGMLNTFVRLWRSTVHFVQTCIVARSRWSKMDLMLVQMKNDIFIWPFDFYDYSSDSYNHALPGALWNVRCSTKMSRRNITWRISNIGIHDCNAGLQTLKTFIFQSWGLSINYFATVTSSALILRQNMLHISKSILYNQHEIIEPTRLELERDIAYFKSNTIVAADGSCNGHLWPKRSKRDFISIRARQCKS